MTRVARCTADTQNATWGCRPCCTLCQDPTHSHMPEQLCRGGRRKSQPKGFRAALRHEDLRRSMSHQLFVRIWASWARLPPNLDRSTSFRNDTRRPRAARARRHMGRRFPCRCLHAQVPASRHRPKRVWPVSPAAPTWSLPGCSCGRARFIVASAARVVCGLVCLAVWRASLHVPISAQLTPPTPPHRVWAWPQYTRAPMRPAVRDGPLDACLC